MSLLLASLVLAAAVPDGVREQVKWLSTTLDDQDAAAAEHTFPEGALFLWEFWGLGLENIAEQTREPGDVERAAKEVRRVLPKLDALLTHTPFKGEKDAAVRGGVIWFGGQNLLRGRLVMITGGGSADEVKRFHRDSAVLARAFAASPAGLLPSFAGLTWPVDNLFALESLKVHDALYGTKYFAPAWAKHARMMDAVTLKSGLPASFVSLDGRAKDVPRGCALSWTLMVLPRLDPVRAKALWAAYKRSFFSCGAVPCLVREYPPGVARKGDVDSGPIIGGYGVAATAFALGAARANEDTTTAWKLEATGELVGAAVMDGSGKRYLGGAVPFVDVLSLYVRTVPLGDTLAALTWQTTTSGDGSPELR
jgi:hypothetical protein